MLSSGRSIRPRPHRLPPRCRCGSSLWASCVTRRGAGGAGGGRESLKAVIYDPDKDELIVVSQGTKLGSRTITAIDPRGVTLSDASGLRRLLMEEGVP